MKNIIELIITILLGLIIVYIVFFSITFLNGLSDARWESEYSNCRKPISKIGYYSGLSKATEWGCELGKPYEGE